MEPLSMVAPPKRSPDRCPTHPGAFLRDIVLPALPVPKAEVARALGISRQSLYDILAEKQPVTPGMAVRLGAVLGTSAASWLNMQTAYDLWHAERAIDTSKMKSLKLAS
jgi:addiction module HigA family antidote